MNPQRKIIKGWNTGTGSSTATILHRHLVVANAINAHGMRMQNAISISGTEQDNFTGFVVLCCFPASMGSTEIQAYLAKLRTSLLGGNGIASFEYVWAVAPWAVTPETPALTLFEPRTSRNCPSGSSIVTAVLLSVNSSNLTYTGSMQWFQTD